MHKVLLTRWAEIGDKIVALAEEFPEEKYDFRPAPDTRSFADQLRHIAFWNEYTEKALKGEKPDGSANELPRAAYATKQALVAALRKSFDGVAGYLGNGHGAPDDAAVDTVVSFIEHNGEHYGQLVISYRLNGLVPPASR
jgi:hypothetical protein